MVRFKCGCIGFPVDSKQYVCVSSCEEPDQQPYLTVRRVTTDCQDSFEPLDEIELIQWMTRINGAISDGERYRNIRRVVKEFFA